MIEPLSSACYCSTEQGFDACVDTANDLLTPPHRTGEENATKKRKAASMIRSTVEQKTHGASKLKQVSSSFPVISERETSSSSDAANDKKAAQKLRNRLSAQQHRERQKKLLLDIRTELDCALAARRDLEWRVKELEHQNYALTFENQTLRQRLEELLLSEKSHGGEPSSLTLLASLSTTASKEAGRSEDRSLSDRVGGNMVFQKATTPEYRAECRLGPFSKSDSLPSSLPMVAIGRPTSPLVGDMLSLTRTPSPVPEGETASSDLYDIPLLFSTTSSGATSVADRWDSPSHSTHATRTPSAPGFSPSSTSPAHYAELSVEMCDTNSPEGSAVMAKDVTDQAASDTETGWSFFPASSTIPADVDAVDYVSPTCLDLRAIVGSVLKSAKIQEEHQPTSDGVVEEFGSCVSEGLLSDRRGLLLSPMSPQNAHFAADETLSSDAQLQDDSTPRHIEQRHQGGCLSSVERNQFRLFSGFEKRQRLQSGVSLSTHSPMQLLLCITLVLVTFLGLSPPRDNAGSSDYRTTHNFGFLPQPAAAAINALTSTVTPYSSHFHWVPFDYFKSRAGPLVEFQLPAFSKAPVSDSPSDKLPPVIQLGFKKPPGSDKSVALADGGGGLVDGPSLYSQKRLEGSSKNPTPRIAGGSQPPTKPSVANVLARRLLRDYLRLLCPNPTLIVGTSEELETYLETTSAALRENKDGSAMDEGAQRSPRLVLSVPISSLAAPAITHFPQADRDTGALSTQELLHMRNSDIPSVPSPNPQPVSASGWRNRSSAGEPSSSSLLDRVYGNPNYQSASTSSRTPPVDVRSPTAASFNAREARDARAAWNMAVRETALRTLKAFTTTYAEAARGAFGNSVKEGGSSPSLAEKTASAYGSNPLARKHGEQERPSMPHHQRRPQQSSDSEALDDMPLHIICDQVNWDALYMKFFE